LLTPRRNKARAGQQFGDVKRLNQIIVRAGIKSGDFIIQRVARGEN
jgi:hypothetical protein